MSRHEPLYLEDFVVGQQHRTAARTITEADIVMFTGLSGDFNPLHIDEEFCKGTQYGTRIAQGLLGTAVATGLVSQMNLTARNAIGFLGMTWKFAAPIFAGDTVHVVTTVTEARSSSKPGRGVLVRKIDVVNQRGTIVQTGEWAIMMKTRPGDKHAPA